MIDADMLASHGKTTAGMQKIKSRTFIHMDGLRGVAAFMVLLFHLQGWFNQHYIFPSSYLSVDLFFMLSGFVIAHAYERKLDETLSVWQFVKTRVIRLYPLYILGSLATFSYYVILAFATGEHWLARDLVYALPFGLAMFPNPLTPAHPFTLNPPGWSLFYELLFNILYAIMLPWLTTRALLGVAFVSIAAVGVAGAQHNSLNFLYQDLIWNLNALRATFGLSTGVVLYRAWAADRLPLIRAPFLLITAIFIGIIAIPESWSLAWAASLLGLVVGFPAIIILAVSSEPKKKAAAIMEWLGGISYPLYALHWSFIVLATGPAFIQIDRPIMFVAAGVAATLAAAFSIKLFDLPVRRYLSARLLQTKGGRASQTELQEG